METVVQFLAPRDRFMARGQVHTIRHVIRQGERREVQVIGERADGGYFEASFPWGDMVDTLDGSPGAQAGCALVPAEQRT